MVYLLGTVVVAIRFGYGPSVLTAVVGTAALNYWFIPPYYAFGFEDYRHLVTTVVMLAVALVISHLTKRLRDESTERGRIAEKADRAQLQNALLTSVSHDLRTPLAVMTGSAGRLLRGGIDEATQRELSETILRESERLNRLVQNLLDMTRVDNEAVRVVKEWHALEEVIGTALGRVEKLLGAREVTTDIEQTLVPVDALLVEQVLVNLFENAVKYSPAGSPLHVGAKRTAGEVIIEVADRGNGVAREDAKRVFEKFYRGHGDRDGAGLGLTICQGIVKAHGGRIWTEPHPGGGASFRFAIPVEGEPPVLIPEA